MLSSFQARGLNSLSRTTLVVRSPLIVFVALSFLAMPEDKAFAQTKASLCSKENSLESVQQQPDASKTLDNLAQRITILIRAADILWPFQQNKAREVFRDAFNLAIQNEKDVSGGKRTMALLLLMERPDQRYVVIRAVARRDSVWARALTEELLSDERRNTESGTVADPLSITLKGQRLLEAARQMIAVDVNFAIELAKTSFRYPASFMISRFLYALAEVNQHVADEIYEQMLRVYAERPMREFLYLKVYPFALDSDGDMPVTGYYPVPARLVANNRLQRAFVQILLRRSKQALEMPLDEGDNFNQLPGNAHILQAISRLGPLVAEKLSDLLPQVVEVREKILVSLPLETQNALISRRGNLDNSSAPGFSERIESAKKNIDPKSRYDLTVEAILASSGSENLDEILAALDGVDDLDFRGVLTDWIKFNHALEAVRSKRFDQAEKLISTIEGTTQRAFLHTEVAKALLKETERQSHARELLDEAISEAQKADVVFAARSLLTIAVLYARLDQGRSLALLVDAIKLVNRGDMQDFSAGDQTLTREFRRRSNPGRFIVRFYMPGLDPGRAFGEMAAIDFDDTFSQTVTLTDPFTRSMALMAVSEVCLQKRTDRPKSKTMNLRPKGVQP